MLKKVKAEIEQEEEDKIELEFGDGQTSKKAVSDKTATSTVKEKLRFVTKLGPSVYRLAVTELTSVSTVGTNLN